MRTLLGRSFSKQENVQRVIDEVKLALADPERAVYRVMGLALAQQYLGNAAEAMLLWGAWKKMAGVGESQEPPSRIIV